MSVLGRSTFESDARRLRVLFKEAGMVSDASLAQVLLYDQSAGAVVEYAVTDAGLTAALAAAGSGDTVVLPACSISGTGWTVGAGVVLRGQSTASVLTGALTVNGTAESMYIAGNVTGGTGSVLRYLVVSATSGNAITSSGHSGAGSDSVVGCLVIGNNGISRGINIVTYAIVRDCAVSAAGGNCATALYAAGGYFLNCNAQGVTGAELSSGAAVEHSHVEGTTTGLVCSSGNTWARNSSFYGAGGTDISVTGGALYIYACEYDGATGTVYAMQGDRGAYSVEDYHASDIEAAALTRHLPTPPAATFGVVSDGTNWVASGSAMAQGSGTSGRLVQFNASSVVGDSTLIKSGAGVLTLSAASAYTLTVPATGIAALVSSGSANKLAYFSDAYTLTQGSAAVTHGGTFSMTRFYAGTDAGGAGAGICDVRGSGAGSQATLTLFDTDVYSTPPAAVLRFGTKYNSGGSYTTGPAIVGGKENATDGNYAYYMAFYTRANGSAAAERMRIASGGAVTIAGGLNVGTATGATTAGYLYTNGRISTNDGTNYWTLLGYTATAPAATGYVTVTINGTTYKLLAST